MPKTVLICVLLLTLLFTACDPISDGGTYAEPTPNPLTGTLDAEWAQLDARATREAMR